MNIALQRAAPKQFADPRSEHITVALESANRLEAVRVRHANLAGRIGDTLLMRGSATPFLRADGTPIPQSEWSPDSKSCFRGVDIHRLQQQIGTRPIPVDFYQFRKDGDKFHAAFKSVAGTRFSSELTRLGVEPALQEALAVACNASTRCRASAA